MKDETRNPQTTHFMVFISGNILHATFVRNIQAMYKQYNIDHKAYKLKLLFLTSPEDSKTQILYQ